MEKGRKKGMVQTILIIQLKYIVRAGLGNFLSRSIKNIRGHRYYRLPEIPAEIFIIKFKFIQNSSKLNRLQKFQ
jgi:hypothetical protein